MIVLDLETMPWADAVGDSDVNPSPIWERFKERKELEDDDACLYPEFGQICCAGLVRLNHALEETADKTLTALDAVEERSLLVSLAETLNKDADGIIIGHNIKGFDIPYMAKRMMSHGIPLPECLRVAGKKPWDIHHKDTQELLKFGGWTSMSLDSACLLLGIPSPKNDLTGAEVPQAMADGRIKEVAEYCMRDVRATAEVYRKIKQLT